MRTRDSNKTRSFRPINDYPELDFSDEDADGADEDPDVAFVQDDADASHDEQDEDAPELILSSDGEVDDISKANHQRRSSTKTKRQINQNQPQENKSTRSPGEVQPYPTDPAAKWTRSYVGPVQRWHRLPELGQYWFGDRDGWEDITNGFLSLWFRYEMLPPKLTSTEQLRIAGNPWMPEGFYENQEVRLNEWYEKYISKSERHQRSTAIPKTTALRWYLPLAERGLVALLGPHDRQREHNFSPGDSVVLSRLGDPIQDDTNTESCGGSLFDVGGMVLSMAWAPRKGDGDQLLAMTVIPFADQAYYDAPDKAPRESTLKQGNIQIWNIGASRSSRGDMCITSSAPKLVSALCFEWGRALRLQWCPVALTVAGKTGLLAVLCGDGEVRVLEVDHPASKGKEGTSTFGKCRSALVHDSV